MDGTIQQIIDLLKATAPAVWQIFIKQAYSEAVSDLLWGIALAAVCFGLIKLFKYGDKQFEKNSWSNWEIGRWFSLMGSAIAGIISFGLIVSAIQWFINPQFYAIRFLLEKITGN